MTIGTGGGIWQGAGTFAAPTTGLKIWNDGGVGRLATYKTGLEQITINTDGQLIAGEGRVSLDRTGLKIIAVSSGDFEPSRIHFKTTGGQPVGWLIGTNSFVALNAQQPGAYSEIVSWRNGIIDFRISNDGTTTTNLVSFMHDRAAFTSSISTMGGIVMGDTGTAHTGVLRIKERTDNNTYPNSTQVDIFARTVGGVQKLYAKFGNGVVRELATAS